MPSFSLMSFKSPMGMLVVIWLILAVHVLGFFICQTIGQWPRYRHSGFEQVWQYCIYKESNSKQFINLLTKNALTTTNKKW
jgi:hypothetical protein